MINEKKIVVVGSDIDAWLTAMSLQLFLAGGDTNIDIEILELPTRLHALDFYSAPPSLRAFHRTMGIPEPKALRSAAGKFTSGQRLSNWIHKERDFLMAYQTLEATETVEDGDTQPIQSLGEPHRLKKSRIPIDIYTHLNNVKLGLNLDAMGYTSIVMRDALALDIKHTKTTRIRVLTNDEGIDGITLDNDQVLKADLYIDATGPKAQLLSQLADYCFESWQEWLPADIKLNARAPAPKTPSNYTAIRGEKYGWMGIYNLTGEIGIRCAYRNTESTIGIVKHLQSVLGLKLIGSREIPLHQGRVVTPWVQNCIALGDACSIQEPLDASDLLLLTQGISHLILALTHSNSSAQARAEFNQKMAGVSEEMRDMLITTRNLIRHSQTIPAPNDLTAAIPESLLTRFEAYRTNKLTERTQNLIYSKKHWSSVFNQISVAQAAARDGIEALRSQ